MRAVSCSPLGWQLPPQDQAAAYTRCPRGPGALLKGPRPDAGRSEPRGGPGAPPRDLTRDGMGTTPNAILPPGSRSQPRMRAQTDGNARVLRSPVWIGA
jgi:hypothetical protein